MIPRLLKIYNFVGPNSLTKRQTIELTSLVRKQIRQELGINLTYTLDIKPDPYPEMNTFSIKPDKYHRIFKIVESYGHAPDEINLAILPPLSDPNTPGFYTTGGSSGVGCVGKPDCTAIVSCWYQNKDMARVAMLHEIGHLLGAHHTNTLDIMNVNAPGDIHSGAWHYGENSKHEIKEYLR